MARRPRRGGLSAQALPGVEADVVVVPARREEGKGAHVRDHVEAHHFVVEPDRAPGPQPLDARGL